MQIPTSRLTYWLSQLVQIPSVNPDAGDPLPEGGGEAAMAKFLAESFSALDGTVELTDVLPGRPNVYGTWRGHTDSWAAIDVHTDTVGISQMSDPPFDGRIEDGKIWGRGAVDTKAGLAVALAVLETGFAAGLTPKQNIVLVGTISEEIGGHGARAFAAWAREKDLKINQLMVAEPTLCVPLYGHKGAGGIRVRISGQAAHSSKPHLGKNAIVAAAPIITALQAEHERLQTIPPQTTLGTGTLSVTLIEGGSGHNVVPAHCTITANRRVVPFETAEEVVAQLTQIVTDAATLPIDIETVRALPAFYQEPDSPWIQSLATWAETTPDVAPYGTNALAYPGLANETVIMGPGSIDQAHGAVEWVEISQLEKMAQIVAQWLF